MGDGEVRQYFVRNDKGTVWGPLALTTIELLIENGLMQGKLQVSEDGIHFAFPGRFPHLREAFPRELWGDVVTPGPSAPAPQPAEPPAAAQPAMPPPGAGPAAAAMAGPGATAAAALRRPPPGASSMAGPGATAAARPGTPPVMGPQPGGVRPAAPPPGAVPSAQAGAVRPPPAGPPGAPVAPAGAPASARPAAPGPTLTPAPGMPPVAARPATPPTPAPGASATPVTPVPGADEAPPSSGQLADSSPVRLYGLLAAGGHTGLLTLTLADCTTSIHFRKGNPEHVNSTHPEDALGTSLTQARLITEDQLRQAEAARERFGGELLAALFGLGLLQPATAFAQLGQRAHNILLRGLRAEAGTFTYEPKDLLSAKAMPLGNKWAVLLDQIRRIPTTELRRRLQPVMDLPVMKSGGRVSTSDLRFTPHEVRSLGTIDGVRSLGQLLTDFAQDADHLLRLVFLLKELDAVSFASASPRAAPPPPAQPKPAAPPPTAVPPPAAAPQAATPPRPATPPSAPAQPAAPAQAAAPRPAAPPPSAPAQPAAPAAAAPRPAAPPPAAAPTAPRPASPPPVAPAAPAQATPAPSPASPPPAAAPPAAPPAPKPAAAPAPKPAASAPAAAAAPVDDLPTLRDVAVKLKDQNHFERLGLATDATGAAVKLSYFKLAKQYHPDTLPPGAPPEMAKLKADIFGFIGDAYRALSDDRSRANYLEELKSGGGGQVDVEAILKAEELFRKASVLVKGKKFAEAVKMLDEAIQLNADEAEFYALRGYSRFFTHTDKKAGYAEALRDFQTCTKKNDKVAVAYYYHGVVAKLCGDNSGALKHFQRTVELQPNHIEAQREIRLAQQRK